LAADEAVEKRGQLEGLKVFPRIQVILSRIIDDPELAERFGVGVGTYLVQLPVLKGRRVVPAVDTKYESARARSAAFSVHGRSR
jgi:hypothetical protein